MARLASRSVAFSDGAGYAFSLGITNGDLFRKIIACSPRLSAYAPGPHDVRMTPATRRQLAAMLCGVGASVIGLTVATALRERACREAGAQWMDAARRCVAAQGAPALGDARAYAFGVAAGIIALVMLWRVYTFFATRGAHRGA